MYLSEIMSLSDWQLLKELSPWANSIIVAIGWQESRWGRDGEPGHPSSREWLCNYGYEDTQVLSQYQGFEEQIKAVNAFILSHMKPILPLTQDKILELAKAWAADDWQTWGKNVWSIFSGLVNDYDKQ
jgi:hypothetical protein